MTIYQHIRHPRIAARRADRPVKVADFLPRGTAINRFNTKVALIITSVVGSMWCAYAFALFDLISLPAAIRGGASEIVSWVAQTFLQLVFLSVIMVGQNVQAAAADKRAEATFHDASATLHEVAHVQGHLAAQDVLLSKIAAKIGLDPVPVIDNPPTRTRPTTRTRKNGDERTRRTKTERSPSWRVPSLGSVSGHAAVDGQRDAGDVGRGGAGQEDDGGVELVLLAHPSQRGGMGDVVLQLIGRDGPVISLRKYPGATALTRMPRRPDHCWFRSRVSPMRPALLAA